MLLEGKQFSHYRILRLIGRGGMGEVYLAEDTQIQRQVASKFIRIETEVSDQEVVDRALRLFWREATAIASLDHANILPLHDHGEITFDDSPLAYLIMPYRPEGSLTTWLRQRGRDLQNQQLSLRQIGQIVQQAALALQYAHDHQIMHLDVKPANFLIRSRATNDEYPDLLLSDFGIARMASATSSLSQNVRGTPTYMAPEQWANQPVFASDQYALAIMAYELLTGHPPFQGAPMNVMYAHIQELPRSICDLNPHLPTAIDLILQRALAKKPDERYPSITAFAQAFQHVPGENTLEMDRTVTPLPPKLDSSSLLRNRQFALPPTQTTLTPPLDTLSRSALPLQDSRSSLVVSSQTDHSAQKSDSSSRDFFASVASSSKSSGSLPTSQATPTNLPPETLTILTQASLVRPARRQPRVLVIGLLILSLLVLVGASIGVYSTILSGWPGQNIQKKTVLQGATLTMRATATITSQRIKAGSVTTTTATTTATPTVQKTSTPNSDHAYPTYLPGHGTFALFDPLSQTDHWHNQADSDTNGQCQFTGGALHALEFSYPRTFHCDGPSFSNFAFEVQMTIIQGDCGGITFRYEIATHNFYQFDICSDNGEYYLFSVADNNYKTLREAGIANITLGFSHSILLAVVAQGSTIRLFVNRQQITSAQDSTYTQGNLALTARDDQAPQTEVAYQNATVWTL